MQTKEKKRYVFKAMQSVQSELNIKLPVVYYPAVLEVALKDLSISPYGFRCRSANSSFEEIFSFCLLCSLFFIAATAFINVNVVPFRPVKSDKARKQQFNLHI